MKKILIVIIFVAGCSSSKNKPNVNLSDIKFSDNFSFEKFQYKLEEYAKNNPYPNIND